MLRSAASGLEILLLGNSSVGEYYNQKTSGSEIYHNPARYLTFHYRTKSEGEVLRAVSIMCWRVRLDSQEIHVFVFRC